MHCTQSMYLCRTEVVPSAAKPMLSTSGATLDHIEEGGV